MSYVKHALGVVLAASLFVSFVGTGCSSGSDGDSCDADGDCDDGRICRPWACRGTDNACYFTCKTDDECHSKVDSSSKCVKNGECQGQCQASH